MQKEIEKSFSYLLKQKSPKLESRTQLGHQSDLRFIYNKSQIIKIKMFMLKVSFGNNQRFILNFKSFEREIEGTVEKLEKK